MSIQTVKATALKEGDIFGIFYLNSVLREVKFNEDWPHNEHILPMDHPSKRLTSIVIPYGHDNSHVKLSECNGKDKAPALSISII